MKRYVYVWCLILLFINLSAKEPASDATICLNMIVKNESKVIERCLESVKPLIDYWVIVDTGSTDGTQAIIKQYMKDIPGELHEQPWVNFEHNRNGALALAKDKADYTFFIDADEVLKFSEDFKKPKLDKDFYYIVSDFSGMNYVRVQLIKNQLNWKWIGVVHEVVNSPQARTYATLEGVKNIINTDGARSADPQKYQKDAQVLETALKTDPTNTRYTFYLAQSYRDANEHAKAIEVYKKRIDMKGWDQEVFWSMLQVALLQETLDMPPEDFISSYYQAFYYRPTRAEPLYYLVRHYEETGDYALGYLLASIGLKIPLPKDILFVEKWIYDYGMLLELSVSAYWIGKYDECKKISKILLDKPNLPSHIRQIVEQNIAFADLKLQELSRITQCFSIIKANEDGSLVDAVKSLLN